jgi:hypothetical protein
VIYGGAVDLLTLQGQMFQSMSAVVFDTSNYMVTIIQSLTGTVLNYGLCNLVRRSALLYRQGYSDIKKLFDIIFSFLIRAEE